MKHNYDKWFYWAGLWQNETTLNIEASFARSDQENDVMIMMKHFMKNMSAVSFVPDFLMVGRIKDSKVARVLYDTDDFKKTIEMFFEPQTPQLQNLAGFKLQKGVDLERDVNRLLNKKQSKLDAFLKPKS